MLSLLLLLMMAAPTFAQEREPLEGFQGAGMYTVVVNSGGERRFSQVYIPSSYNPNAPAALVIAMHGAGGSGAGFSEFSGFVELADEEGFIVAFPDGLNRAWNDARPDARVLVVNDVAFISRLIDFISANIEVDSNRVYATGYSMGGMMAFRLGCQLQDKIAAVAAVGTTFPAYQLDACLFINPVPVMIIQGTDDPIVPVMGGRDRYGNRLMMTAAESVQYWAEENECDMEASAFTLLDDTDPEDGTRVLEKTYEGCEAEVVLLLVRDGGHTWPGHEITAPFELGLTSRDIEAAETIWAFFERNARE